MIIFNDFQISLGLYLEYCALKNTVKSLIFRFCVQKRILSFKHTIVLAKNY